MSFLLALIFYNASLQINIVPQCKDWSIFCFDLADDLIPCKTKSAKIRLENDGLLIPVDHSWSLDQSSIVFMHARCKNGHRSSVMFELQARSQGKPIKPVWVLGGSIEITAFLSWQVLGYAC